MAMTQKEFWIQAYLNLLTTHGPRDAVAFADEALDICDERWKTPVVEGTVQLLADVPVGRPDYSRPSKTAPGRNTARSES